MLKELILRHSSRRAAFKLATVLGGVAILLVSTIEKVGVAKSFLWMAAPLLLLGLAEAGYAAEQQRCVELLKKSGGSDESAVLLPEATGASVARFAFAVLSLSIWPYYLVLFALVALGGEEIARGNREAAGQAAHNLNAAMAGQPYLPTTNGSYVLPNASQRPANAPAALNRPPLNPALQRVTPPPFATPPHFTIPPRSATLPQAAPVTPPPPLPTQNASPAAASPAPGAKNP